MKVTGLCDMIPCTSVDSYRHLEERAVSIFRINVFSEFAGNISFLKYGAFVPKNITSHTVKLRTEKFTFRLGKWENERKIRGSKHPGCRVTQFCKVAPNIYGSLT
jgi:hypothetical protein